MALNKTQRRTMWIALAAVILILIVDQTSKVWVKTNMHLSETKDIFPWFKILFTENPGMAFGIELVDTYVLTIFRIIVVSVLGVVVYRLIKREYKTGFVICFACIMAGALGNIFDCAFYGVLFNESSFGKVAEFMPEGGGYSTFLHGRVVDMLYFPLVQTTWPSWVPKWGGSEFVFFRPIFNIADSSICVSVFVLLLFYRRTFSLYESKTKTDDEQIS